MAEPENFEDDLFADLYDDNDASAVPAQAKAPAPAPAQSAQVQAPAPVAAPIPQPSVEAPSQPEFDQTHNDVAYAAEENGYGDEYQDEAYEDDDDVDFNLGNDPSATGSAAQPQQEDMASYHTTRGPSAKEDGTIALEAVTRNLAANSART
ncbi:hypothetical protein M426DRAFT_92737 [Hypoxylon sp. CI-4A]|nr:hypothetical protein M426DRAFT_92737 [Hypoxylon sp. CI-4A]